MSFSMNPNQQQSSTSGPMFNILVRLCGLGGLAALALPYLMGSTGLEFYPNLIDGIANGSAGYIIGGTTAMGSITKIVVLLSFLVIPLAALFMLLTGKYKGGQLTLLIVYLLAAYLLVNFFGSDAGLSRNFFFYTDIGFWLGCGALFLPFVGMFFLDKSI